MFDPPRGFPLATDKPFNHPPTMNFRDLFLPLTFIFPLLTGSLSAFPEDALRADLERFREEYGLTGMLVGAWRGDEPVFREAFGMSQAGVPADLSMKIRAGGLCLTSLTAVLLQTAAEGTVSLDDAIDEWMPELPASDQVTLRMLANCTAGYGDYVPNEDFIDAFLENPFRHFTPEKLIEYGLVDGMLYEPGAGWNYSHTNFVILGEILQEIHGRTVAELLEDRVFSPLRLKDTVYTEGPSLDPPVLHAFTTERGVFEDSTFWNPSWTSFSGSVAATLDDVAAIIRAIGSASLIPPESLREMIAPTTVGLGGNTAETYYAMGIGVKDGWMVQNPNFGGYQGILLYQIETDTTLVAFVTLGRDSDPETHHGMKLLPILQDSFDGSRSDSRVEPSE